MNQAKPSRHLDALARFSSAIAEVTEPARGDSLLFLRQIPGLVDVHVCRVIRPGAGRRIDSSYGADEPCELPEPRWHEAVRRTRTDRGWLVGYDVPNYVERTVLHVTFERAPDPDDIAAGEVAANLLARTTRTADEHSPQLDALTGLLGRSTWEEGIAAAFAGATCAVTMILLDISGLKTVNDRFGHHAGDRLLRQVATIVTSAAASLGPTALTARIGGDEFAVVAHDIEADMLADTLGRIDAAADELGDGVGIAHGVATLPAHPPGQPSPSMATTALFRLADAQLYRHKSSSGRTVRWPPGAEAVRQAQRNPGGLTDGVAPVSRAPGPEEASLRVEQDLIRVARRIADEANAAAWWISRQVGDTVVDHGCGRTRRDPLKWDEPDQPVILEPKPYNLDEFPATRRALSGDVFYATLTEGEDAERAMLGYHGYRSIVAAGGADREGTGWLVEIYGDQLSYDLRTWQDDLQQATTDVLTAD